MEREKAAVDEGQAAGIDHSRIEAFVASNAGYYVGKWAAAESGEENPAFGFNLAAFFLSSFWLLYRRLYIHLGIFALVIIVDVAITSYLESSDILPYRIVNLWDRFSPFVYGSVIGLFANRWYYRRFKAAEASAVALSAGANEQLDHLRTKGGTNVVGVFVLLLMIIAAIYWVFFSE